MKMRSIILSAAAGCAMGLLLPPRVRQPSAMTISMP